jgi:hypothetical protein
MARFASCPGTYEDIVRNEILQMTPDNLRHAFRFHCNDFSRHILVIEPGSSRGLPKKRFASRYVFELLWKERLCSWTFDLGYFYNRFRASPTTTANARWVFESRICQLLMEQQTIRVFPITQSTPGPASYVYEHYPGKNPVDLQMARTEEHRSVANHRYHLRSADLPAIDPLFLIYPPDDSPPIPLAFEATQNGGDHDTNKGGLRRIDTSDLNPKLYRHCVVVALEGTQPKITVPKAYHEVTSVNQPLPDEVLRVFSYPVPRDVLFPKRWC